MPFLPLVFVSDGFVFVLGSSFIAEEYGSARSGRNQEFIDGLVKAADRILREVCKIDKTGHVW